MKLKAAPENLLERIALSLNLAPKPLLDTQVAFTTARAIMAAAELGVFETIGKGTKTAEQIAGELKSDPAATAQLLNCLVGIGYLRWTGGQYSLSPKMHKWLLKDSPSNLINKLRFQLLEWDWMTKLEDFVRTGKSMDLHAVIGEKEWTLYQEGMRDVSVNTAKELAGKLKLPAAAVSMLDIGGSHGLYSIWLCQKNPALYSTILELPGAIQQASAIAAKSGQTEKITYKAGNALEDDLGTEQYDLVMINNVVHHFTDAQNRRLAEKVTRALKPGGIYAIGEFIRQHHPGEGGAVASTMSLYFSMTSASGNWSVEEINSWQQGAGLKIQKPISLLSLPGWKMLTAAKL